MDRRQALAAAGALLSGPAWAQPEDTVKVGLILPMTGPFASTGRQVDAAVRLYLAERKSSLTDGRRVEVLLRDDAGIADNTRRYAPELLVNHKVPVLAGFGLTPCALAVAPLATQTKTPTVIMCPGSAVVMPASPYFVRTAYQVRQTAVAMARWASKNKLAKVVTLVSDFAPGLESEKAFKDAFEALGGKLVGSVRVPMRDPDFAPFLQKVRDLAPDAVYVFVPSGPSATLMKQFRERGLANAGIRLIGDGGVTDDDMLNEMDDSALGTVTALHYATAHPSEKNRKFVRAFEAANKGMRPNFMAVGGYDGMHVVFKALEATAGRTGGDALLGAMKGLAFESPRGPIAIDARSGDVVQNVYVRRVERVDGQLHNVEIDLLKPEAGTPAAQR